MWAVGLCPWVLSGSGPLASRNACYLDQVSLSPPDPQHPSQFSLTFFHQSQWLPEHLDSSRDSGIKQPAAPSLAASSHISRCCSTFLHESPELMDKNTFVHCVDWWLHPTKVRLWEESVKGLLMGSQLGAVQCKTCELFSESEAWFTSKTKKLRMERPGVWFQLSSSMLCDLGETPFLWGALLWCLILSTSSLCFPICVLPWDWVIWIFFY